MPPQGIVAVRPEVFTHQPLRHGRP